MLSKSCAQSFSASFTRLLASRSSRAFSSLHASTRKHDEIAANMINNPMAIDKTSNHKLESEQELDEFPRLPRSVQAIYLRPLRREAKFGVPSCDLQMRSYSVRNLEFFADFALRAAYYLNLPAFGPIPLPRITERWTVPKSNFIFKKAQENFERVTMRRLIQIRDGHPETVELWLAFLKKHSYYGVGMKANIWEYDELAVGKTMDAEIHESKAVMELFGRDQKFRTSEKVVELMNSEKFRLAASGNAPMTSS